MSWCRGAQELSLPALSSFVHPAHLLGVVLEKSKNVLKATVLARGRAQVGAQGGLSPKPISFFFGCQPISLLLHIQKALYFLAHAYSLALSSPWVRKTMRIWYI